MQVDVRNMKGKKVDSVELPPEIFETAINVDLMHQAYVRQMANARLGTHSTKAGVMCLVVVENPGGRKVRVVLDKVLSVQHNGLVVEKSIHPNRGITPRRCRVKCVAPLYVRPCLRKQLQTSWFCWMN